MAIKDLIVFFVESAMMLIPAITEGILALAAGSVAGVAIAIEKGLAGLIGLVINLFAKLIGLGGLSKKVMVIFGKVRKRIDRVITKLLKKAQKAGRKLMGKLGIGAKEKPKNPKEHDEQVKAGLMYLDQVSNKEDKDNNKALTETEAQKVAAKTKAKFPVFTSIKPRNQGGKWVYDWKGSNGTKKTDDKVESGVNEDKLAPGPENKALGILKSPSISNRKGSLEGSGTILASNLGHSTIPTIGTRSDYQAHHIIATSSAKKSTAANAAAQSGYNINRSSNGVWLPDNPILAQQVRLPLHKGKHLGKYFRTVDTVLDSIKDRAIKSKNKNKPWDEVKMLTEMNTAEINLRGRLLDLKDPIKLQSSDPLKPVDPIPKKRTF